MTDTTRAYEEDPVYQAVEAAYYDAEVAAYDAFEVYLVAAPDDAAGAAAAWSAAQERAQTLSDRMAAMASA